MSRLIFCLIFYRLLDSCFPFFFYVHKPAIFARNNRVPYMLQFVYQRLLSAYRAVVKKFSIEIVWVGFSHKFMVGKTRRIYDW